MDKKANLIWIDLEMTGLNEQKERIMEMEASQKRVSETLDKLRVQMNEINKRLEHGYQQSVSGHQEEE